MPRAVEAFAQTQNFAQVKSIQDNILALYRMDVAKYAKGDTLLVEEIYDHIPSQLDSQSKRFLFASVAANGTYERLASNFLWLTNAGVALPARNVSEPRHPLRLSESRSYFKLFMNDVGLLSAACGMAVVKGVISDSLGVNYGSVYENAIAQELKAHGFEPYYFRSKGMGELDFVIELSNGCVVPIEVKSGKTYKRHNALDNVLASKNYAIDRALVLCEGNLSTEGRVCYCPVYMVAVLER